MTRWTARVWADRDHWELVAARPRVEGAGVPEFPGAPAEFEVDLRGEEVRIGRRPVPDDGPAPDDGPGPDDGPAPDDPGIDLTGPPRDPGVSRLHAVLMAVGGDRWVVLDPGSTNGTTLNYDTDLLEPGTAVELEDGDRIHVGAWTTITVERR